MCQQNSSVCSESSTPGIGEMQEIPGVVCKEGTAFLSCEGKLKCVCCAQVSSLSGCEAINAVLAQDSRQGNRD